MAKPCVRRDVRLARSCRGISACAHTAADGDDDGLLRVYARTSTAPGQRDRRPQRLGAPTPGMVSLLVAEEVENGRPVATPVATDVASATPATPPPDALLAVYWQQAKPCIVRVDRAQRGRSPLLRERVSPGRHQVSIWCRSRRAFSAALEFEAGKTVEIRRHPARGRARVRLVDNVITPVRELVEPSTRRPVSSNMAEEAEPQVVAWSSSW